MKHNTPELPTMSFGDQRPQAVLTYSGGLDSTVLLYYLLNLGFVVRCMGVCYGQRHAKELRSAKGICAINKCEYVKVDLASYGRSLFGGSSQTDHNVEVPEGHYAAESMKATVVPNRNMVLLSLAAAWAVATKSQMVAYAAHAGDHTIYPDCRPEFADAMDKAIKLADWHTVQLVRPFVHMTKADIVREGAKLGVPFHLTWSCYKGGAKHCGVCGTCQERREAFVLAGVTDPTEYD